MRFLALVPLLALLASGCGDSNPETPTKSASKAHPDKKDIIGAWGLLHWNHEPANRINIRSHHIEFKDDDTFVFQSTGSGALKGHFVQGEGEWHLQNNMLMVRSKSSYRETLVEIRNGNTLIFARDPVILKDRIQPGSSAYKRAKAMPKKPQSATPPPAP